MLGDDLLSNTLSYRPLLAGQVAAVDLSKSTEQTLELLRNTVTPAINIVHFIERDIFSEEKDSKKFQALLLRLFDTCNTKFSTARALTVELKIRIFERQTCACCASTIEGQYLELIITNNIENSSVDYKDMLGLDSNHAHKLATKADLLGSIDEIHKDLDNFDGHFIIKSGNENNISWHMLLHIASDQHRGFKLDNQVLLDKYQRP